MAKKKRYYAIYSAQFIGIVDNLQDFQKHIKNKKKVVGKGFSAKKDAEIFLTQLEATNGKIKEKVVFYAVYGPLFTGIVQSKSEFDKYVNGKKQMHGKQVKSIKEGEDWIDKWTKKAVQVGKKSAVNVTVPKIIEQRKATPSPQKGMSVPSTTNNHQCIVYIDGGFKGEQGKYGILAFNSCKIEPIYKDFGVVYDESFNQLKNTGAEIMACIRALEWAYANDFTHMVIVYDYEGIRQFQHGQSTNKVVRLFVNILEKYKKRMDIQFVHVRHSNKELHQQVHNLTQLEI